MGIAIIIIPFETPHKIQQLFKCEVKDEQRKRFFEYKEHNQCGQMMF